MRRLPALVLALSCTSSFAQGDWPQRPVRMLVGFGPGGGTDIVARIVAPAMGDALGQPVVVENRPGAGGTVAAAQVAKSAPDGYTAFMLNNGFAVSAVMMRALAYDPLADFQPVSLVATMPLVILTGTKSGIADLKALVEAARSAPGKLNFASVGVGGTQHFAGELLFQLAGLQLTHVPYKGTPNAVAATQTNEAQVLAEVAASVLGPVRGGALKALAVTSAAPFPGLPDVPTARQAGIADYDVTTWYALAFPARTPAPVVERTVRALRTALGRDEVRKQMANAAFLPETSSPEALAAHVRAEIARWAAVRDRAGIKPE